MFNVFKNKNEKKYNIFAVINGRVVENKNYTTRKKANKKMDKILDEYGLMVNDIVYRNRCHDIEYVISDKNIIRVNNLSKL